MGRPPTRRPPTPDERLLLAPGVDAAGVSLALLEPRWLRAVVGGAGFAPLAAFVVRCVFALPPVTAAAVLEEVGPSFLRLAPTAVVGWEDKGGRVVAARAVIKGALAGVGIKLCDEEKGGRKGKRERAV